jgi:hypothetical protein
MKVFIVVLIVFVAINVNAQKYRSSSSKISFLSETALEDIFGESKKSNSALKADEKQIAILMKTNTFVFKNPMMQEHFQEDYIECEKFPNASFNGDILGDFNVKKDGEYNVTVKGKLTIHGVEKERDVKGKIIVKKGIVRVEAKFAVKLTDHGVKVPTVVLKNIAEVVEVSINITYKEVPVKK